jgi:hypothetical protein
MSVIEPGNDNVPLTEEVIARILKTGIWAEDPALTLVKNDTYGAETAKAAKQWIAGWNAASIIYQSTTVPKYWEGTQVERANIPFYTVAKAVNSLTPQIVNGLFFDDPPFIFQPRPGTRQNTVEAISDIISFQLKEINFKEECRRGVLNACLYGTNIWKWGWDSYSKTETYYAREDNKTVLPDSVPGQPDQEFHDPNSPLEEQQEEYQIDQPRFENITSIKDILIDPTLRTPDIREAKFVIHRMYLTYNDLEKLRDRPGYNIPSREEVISWFMPPAEEAIPALDEQTGLNAVWDMRSQPRWMSATDDPFQKPLEVLERWDKEKVIIVVQQKKVICNGPNPYGEIPFFSVNWWDVPGAFYGLGLSRTIGSEQRLQQGIVNTWLDSTALALAGVYTRRRGKSIPTQSLRIHPGRVIEVDEVDDLKPLERTPAVPEAGQHLSLSQARVEQNSGAGEITTQGIAGSTGHSNLARTAAGANLIGGGQGVQVAEFIEKFSQQVFIPFLYKVDQMNRRLLPAKTIQKILNDELQNQYFSTGGDIQEIREARIVFDIQAGSKLTERRAMAQSLPLLSQFLQNQFIVQALAAEGKKIDTKQVLKMMFEASGWRTFYDVIVDQTPQERQAYQQNQPAALQQNKMQNDNQMQQQKFIHQQELAEQNNLARASNEVLRRDFEISAQPEALTGEASQSPEGFGGLG